MRSAQCTHHELYYNVYYKPNRKSILNLLHNHITPKSFNRRPWGRVLLVARAARVIMKCLYILWFFVCFWQETLLKLSAESRTEDQIVFVDETTELLTKLQRPLLSDGTGYATESTPGTLAGFLANTNQHQGGAWLQRVRSIIIRSDQITVSTCIMITWWFTEHGHYNYNILMLYQ